MCVFQALWIYPHTICTRHCVDISTMVGIKCMDISTVVNLNNVDISTMVNLNTWIYPHISGYIHYGKFKYVDISTVVNLNMWMYPLW